MGRSTRFRCGDWCGTTRPCRAYRNRTFAFIHNLVAAGEHDAALSQWRSVADLTQLLFVEPSPAPIKYWLWRAGLIDSAELRLPMTEVSAELAARLDREIERACLPSSKGA
jgi:4-hydroxy-tetrahydrodipicolinate synthase